MIKTNWNDLFKIRLANPIEAMDKHDLIKILIVRKLLRLHPKRSFIRIYTEFSLNNGSHLKPDIFFQDLKNKSVLCYEIQKNYTPKYEREKHIQYDKVEVPYMKTLDLIVIPLKEAPDNISELNAWLDKYCF